MKYSEILEKYKAGQLSGDERTTVENDIEKHEALTDYIAERDDIGLGEMKLTESETENDIKSADDINFTKRIKRQIRLSFLKAGLITGCLVLAAVMFIVYALPGLVASRYYDPSKVLQISEFCEVNQMDVDISVHTELFVPESFRQTAIIENEGYGNYTFIIPQHESYSNAFSNTSGTIKQNNMLVYSGNKIFSPRSINRLLPQECGVESHYTQDYDYDKKEFIDSYPESGLYDVYITFDHTMKYDEVMDWMDANPVNISWCAVCSDKKVHTADLYGFKVGGGYVCLGYENDKYPLLTFDSLYYKNKMYSFHEDRFDENTIKTHLISMLNYCADDASNIFFRNDTDALRDAAKSIEQNGFEVYGIYVKACDKTEARRLLTLDSISYITCGGMTE